MKDENLHVANYALLQNVVQGNFFPKLYSDQVTAQSMIDYSNINSHN